MNENKNKLCIIYWGLIRGFKYEKTYLTHKKNIYDKLNNQKINFDVYIITNEKDYDDIYINKIPNVVILKILKISNIRKNEKYIKSLKNIQYTTPGWNDIFQENISLVNYNKNFIFKLIPSNYKKYLAMDISHNIEKLDIKFFNNNNCVPKKHNCNGYNPRFLISNYDTLKIELTKLEYIINNKNLIFHNPEMFLKYLFDKNNIKIIETDDIIINRIRTNGEILYDL